MATQACPLPPHSAVMKLTRLDEIIQNIYIDKFTYSLKLCKNARVLIYKVLRNYDEGLLRISIAALYPMFVRIYIDTD